MYTIVQALPGDFWLAITRPHFKVNDYIDRPVNITHELYVALTAEEVGQLMGGN